MARPLWLCVFRMRAWYLKSNTKNLSTVNSLKNVILWYWHSSLSLWLLIYLFAPPISGSISIITYIRYLNKPFTYHRCVHFVVRFVLIHINYDTSKFRSMTRVLGKLKHFPYYFMSNLRSRKSFPKANFKNKKYAFFSFYISKKSIWWFIDKNKARLILNLIRTEQIVRGQSIIITLNCWEKSFVNSSTPKLIHFVYRNKYIKILASAKWKIYFDRECANSYGNTGRWMARKCPNL